ncbi:hypothetical protein P7C70_g4600, partial [Phenoliferia sp. Uapishka_3]
MSHNFASDSEFDADSSSDSGYAGSSPCTQDPLDEVQKAKEAEVLWYRPHLEQMEEYLDREYPDSSTAEAITFHDKRLVTLDLRVQDGQALLDWEAKKKEEKAVERKDIRSEKKAEIERRFLADGWDKSDFDAEWAKHPHIKNNKVLRLTDRSWKIMKPQLEDFLTARRAQRHEENLPHRQQERRQQLEPFYNAYWSSLSTSHAATLPGLYDLLNFDAFSELWIPDDVNIDQTAWDAAVRKSNLAGSRQYIKTGFYELAVKAYRKSGAPARSPARPDASTDSEMNTLLARTTSVFLCQHKLRENATCGHAASYPAIIDHIVERHSRRMSADHHNGLPSRLSVDGTEYECEAGDWMLVEEEADIPPWVVALGQAIFEAIQPKERKGYTFRCRFKSCSGDDPTRLSFAQIAPEAPAEAEWHLTTPEASYDHNFVHRVPTRLETPGGVVLLPLVPSLHAAALYSRFVRHPIIYNFLPYGPFPSLAAFLTHLENRRRDQQIITFAIFDQSLILPPCDSSTDDTTRPERIAGQISFTKTDAGQRQAEMGAVILSPEFHRTHVLTHAAALALRYAFEELKLRRMQWYAHSGNKASPVAARRLGFRDEGVVRWEWVLPLGKVGEVGSEGPEGHPTRHVYVLGMGWDDWKGRVEGNLDTLIYTT